MSVLSKISADADNRYAALAGIVLMLLAVFLFAFGDAVGKFIVATYSVGQLLLLRACASFILVSPMIWKQRAAFRAIQRPKLQLIRIVLSTLEVAAFFWQPSICRSRTSLHFIWPHRFLSQPLRRFSSKRMSDGGAGAPSSSASLVS